jgi:hypothetical protein
MGRRAKYFGSSAHTRLRPEGPAAVELRSFRQTDSTSNAKRASSHMRLADGPGTPSPTRT